MTSPFRRFACVALALFTGSCMDGPFPRVNPNDPTVEFTMSLVSSSDTLSPTRLRVVMQVVTVPAISGYDPNFTLTVNPYAYHAGNGVIVLTSPPTAQTTVTVTASFQNRSASKVLVLLPTP